MSDARAAGPEEPLERRGVAWDRALVWFMRVVAALWIGKGLVNWMLILGEDPFGGPPFQALPTAFRGFIVIFAVLDIVAGVGLWLTSTWGGVMWLLAVMSHILVGVLAPGGPGPGYAAMAAESALVVGYIALSWLASREA